MYVCGTMKLGFCVLVAFLGFVSAQFSGDKVIRVVPKNEESLLHLRALQTDREWKIEFWKSPSHVGIAVDMHVTNDVYKRLASCLHKHGLEFSIQIFDVQKVLDEQNLSHHGRSAASWYSIYHPLNEIYDELKKLAAEYYRNGNVLVFTLGKSYTQRDQKAIMIKGKRGANKPVFFMNCGIHAREWVSPATCMYIAKQLLSRYGRDADVTSVLDKMDFVIVPVVNPDGYVHTWTRYRFWRKTLKPNKGTWCVGTDPNRNWDFKWGEPGASTDPCDDSYRGSHAFSEIETKNIANYLKRLGGRVKGYMDIHAYSQLWMIPWGYTKTPTSDHQELMRVSNIGVSAIRNAGYNTDYKVGPSSVIIYQNSGGSKDYTYGVLGIKYSFALELRDKGAYGFLLPASQIIPTAMETFQGIIAVAKAMKI